MAFSQIDVAITLLMGGVIALMFMGRLMTMIYTLIKYAIIIFIFFMISGMISHTFDDNDSFFRPLFEKLGIFNYVSWAFKLGKMAFQSVSFFSEFSEQTDFKLKK